MPDLQLQPLIVRRDLDYDHDLGNSGHSLDSLDSGGHRLESGI